MGRAARHTRHMGWVVLGCSLAAAACAEQADEGDTTRDPPRTEERADAIVNGEELPSDAAFARGIVSLRTYFGRKGGPTKLDPTGLSASPEQCTATVVGPSWLITARHCIWDESYKIRDLSFPMMPWTVPTDAEPAPGKVHYRVGSQIRLDAGLSPSLWSLTCDLQLRNARLSRTQYPQPVPRADAMFPPGPRLDAEMAKAKAPKPWPPGLLPTKPLVKQQPGICQVWLSSDDADIALIWLPPKVKYPASAAGVALYDGDVHKLLDQGGNVDADLFGYSPIGFGKAAPRKGGMRLLTREAEVGTVDPKYKMRGGYAHFDPLPGGAPGPQFIAGGDSGGPALLRGGADARALQVGVNSYNNPGVDAVGDPVDKPPSYVVQPYKFVAAMLAQWFEKFLSYAVASPTPWPVPTASRPYLQDWNGDGLTDLITVGATEFQVRLATPTGYAAPTVRDYAFSAAFNTGVDVERTVPMRLRNGVGPAEPALVRIDDTGSLNVYREMEDSGKTWVWGNWHGNLPESLGKSRKLDNTVLAHVTDPARDELLLVDPFSLTLVRQDEMGKFLVAPSELRKTPLVDAQEYAADFRVADVNGDGRTDFIHRRNDGVVVLLGQSTGTFETEVFTAYGQVLPSTAGVSLADLDNDKRADLVWIDRQSAPMDARHIHVRLASKTAPGSFGPDVVSPIEIGDSWFVKGGGSDPVTVGGYDIGDVTGDGIPDLANVGTFGTLANSGTSAIRTPALFVKPGRGDGTFAELRVFRLPVDALSVKTNLADSFALVPTRVPGRADPVFVSNLEAGVLDVLLPP